MFKRKNISVLLIVFSFMISTYAFCAPLKIECKRLIPEYYTPCTTATVTISITRQKGVLVSAIDEHPPESWKVVDISDGGAWDDIFKKIKWGLNPTKLNNNRTVRYEILPPKNFTDISDFYGRSAHDGIVVLTTGGMHMQPSGITPQTLIDHLLGRQPLPDDKLPAAYFNNDSKVDISDYILLTRALRACDN